METRVRVLKRIWLGDWDWEVMDMDEMVNEGGIESKKNKIKERILKKIYV